MHVKKGDRVKVIAGKDKGATGVIVRALPRERKVVIDGVGLVKRHLRGVGKKIGQIVERPRAIDASNVALLESKGKKAV